MYNILLNKIIRIRLKKQGYFPLFWIWENNFGKIIDRRPSAQFMYIWTQSERLSNKKGLGARTGMYQYQVPLLAYII